MRRPKTAPAVPALRRSSVAAVVDEAVRAVRVLDAVTALRQPAIAALRRAGIDDLLNDTRLVAEALRSLGMTYGRFWHLTAERRSELLWRHLFVDNAPLSTAARGVLTDLRGLGLTPRRGDLARIRRWFAEKRPDWLIDRVFEAAGVESVVAVCDPFGEVERRRWLRGFRSTIVSARACVWTPCSSIGPSRHGACRSGTTGSRSTSAPGPWKRSGASWSSGPSGARR